MNKIDLLYGFIIGLAASLLGSFLFMTFFTDYEFIEGVGILKSQGYLGKLITVGSLLDLAAFGILLKMNKELMARGVVLAVFVIMKHIVNIILSKVLLTVKSKWKICKRMFICATHGGKMYGRRNTENQKKVKRYKFGKRI